MLAARAVEGETNPRRIHSTGAPCTNIMACSLGSCVVARAQRVFVWTVTQRAADRCCLQRHLRLQRPAQQGIGRVPIGGSSSGIRPLSVPASLRGATAAEMDPAVENVVERIHSSTVRIVLYLGGGASQAVGWLLSVPGASRTVLDMRVPYSRASLTDVLGSAPKSYACTETAKDMARAAYRQAVKLSSFGTDVVGVGCTCALATDREKRGEHKAFITTYNGSQERSFSLLLAKNARSRWAEDALVSKVLVKAVAESMGLSTQTLEIELIEEGAAVDRLKVESSSVDVDHILRELLNGRVDTVEFSGGNVFVDAPRPGRIYLPGSFNPLHDGHKEMLQAAARMRPDMEPCFELSIGNADKGLLPLEEIKRRVSQFTSTGLPLVVTQAPLFTQKADLFHDSLFVVGYDTAVRLVKPEYYGSDQAMLLQFAKLRHQGCSFLVAGRCNSEGKFCTLADVEMPDMLPRGGLFEEIPASEFRADVSSTELRRLGL